jgi:hypothetical protein
MIDGKIILYSVWILTIISLFIFIPKNKVRLAWVAFLFKQCITWPSGLLVADMGWIQYPIRFFENANYTSFTFEYFFYPVIGVYFNVYFPEKKSLVVRTSYYILFCTVLSFAELFIHYYTSLIDYIHWNAAITWVTLLVTFYITRKFCLWFFKTT